MEIHWPTGNLGVAGSYNYLLKALGPTVIATNDTRFEAGTLKECDRFIAERPDYPIHCLHAMCVFNIISIFMDQIGWFDENLWPWGWDDIDVRYRMRKICLKPAIFPRTWGTIFHEHPTQSVRASPPRLKRSMRSLARMNRIYGMEKWGIKRKHFFMRNPKNRWAIDPLLLLDAGNGWNLNMEMRSRRLTLLREEAGINSQLAYCMPKG